MVKRRTVPGMLRASPVCGLYGVIYLPGKLRASPVCGLFYSIHICIIILSCLHTILVTVTSLQSEGGGGAAIIIVHARVTRCPHNISRSESVQIREIILACRKVKNFSDLRSSSSMPVISSLMMYIVFVNTCAHE